MPKGVQRKRAGEAASNQCVHIYKLRFVRIEENLQQY